MVHMNAHVLKDTVAMGLCVKVNSTSIYVYAEPYDYTQVSIFAPTFTIHSSDVDECSTVLGICSQECNNTIGSYICFCEEGYILEPDGYNCTGKHLDVYFQYGVMCYSVRTNVCVSM